MFRLSAAAEGRGELSVSRRVGERHDGGCRRGDDAERRRRRRADEVD